MKVLVIRLSALGDVAMTVPVIYSVARQNPGVQFTVLTRPFFARIFLNRPDNVTVMEADYKGRHRGFKGSLELLRELAAEGFTHVADLHNVSRSWQIDTWLRLHGAHVAMVDKARAARRKVMAGGEAQKAYIERYVEVFERMGLTAPLPAPPRGGDITTPLAQYPKLNHTALPLGGAGRGAAVGIAPFARYANKTYPPELMREVVRLLHERGVSVYLFGARGKEADELATWPNATSLAGQFPIEQELAVMAQLDVMVAMDSANQHLAALAGTRVVTIWGSTTPACGFTPFGQNPSDSLVAGLPCQPCTIAGSEKCRMGGLQCLRALTPEKIVDKVLALL